MNPSTPPVVEITTKNTPSLTMGIIAIVLGVIGLLVGWIPFIGLVAIPIAAIGGFLGLIGLILAACKKFRGWSMPLLGSLICGVTIVVSISSTGATTAAISGAVDEASKAHKAEQAKIETIRSTYIAHNLQVADIQASYRNSAIEGKVPGVSFTIKNTGDRTLKRIKVTCYFLDAAGKRIAEETYQPVSEFDLTDGKPLKPGYTWSMSNNRFFSAKGIPKEWMPGKVEVIVSDIEFQ